MAKRDDRADVEELSIARKNQDYSEYSQQYEEPDPGLLETFPNPAADEDRNPAGAHAVISIQTEEFTCLCPATGQPDWATIEIDYVPDQKCVESKSLKLYLMTFRQYGTFHEACVQRILSDLLDLLEPYMIQVRGKFRPRGGISFWPTSTYIHPQYREMQEQHEAVAP